MCEQCGNDECDGTSTIEEIIDEMFTRLAVASEHMDVSSFSKGASVLLKVVSANNDRDHVLLGVSSSRTALEAITDRVCDQNGNEFGLDGKRLR